MNPIRNETFQDLVNQATILDFSRRVIYRSYAECVPGYEQDMGNMLDEVFDRLLKAAKRTPAEFKAAIPSLATEVVRRKDPDFWFGLLYEHYKVEVKATRRFENLKGLIFGQHILDYGCGDGWLSLVLKQHGYQPFMTDILDYRAEAARGLPFAALQQPIHIPAGDHAFDTALVMAVLHHVELDDLPAVMQELHRTSQRVIVEEDTCGLPTDLAGLSELLDRDEFLREFTGMTLENQYRYLIFIDYFANAITQGIGEMDFPFNFRSVPEWWTYFHQHGFQVSQTQVMGFQPGFFNRSCHVWFVLDRLD